MLMTSYPKKLIEVALPLSEINDASGYDKRPGIGPHPKGIHHWWARLPLPTARAVLFASVVDDPSSHPEKWPTEEAQNAERERLFDIIRKMMGKKLHEHPEVYAEVQSEIIAHCDGKLPAVYDPFAGGGSIPLEASRMGFQTHAGDLNPVAVLLDKSNLALAPRWVGYPPVNTEDRKRIGGTEAWRGTHGLAADVRYYGEIIRDRARAKIGHLYPKVNLPKDYGGGQANVIAWIWARTVASPNPAVHGKHVPLISTYWLSSKNGNEAWLDPVCDKSANTYRFEVRTGVPKNRAAVGAGTKNGKAFRCLLTDVPIPFDHIRDEGRRPRLGSVMLAVVVELPRGRGYMPVTEDQVVAANAATPTGFPDTDLPGEALGFRVQNYGIRKHWQMFTPRQLTAMVTLSDLVKAVHADVRRDSLSSGLSNEEGDAYARTVVTLLALAVDRCADFNNALCRWDQSGSGQRVKNLFGRHAIPMVWDFAEANVLGEKSVCWQNAVEITAAAIESVVSFETPQGTARQIDAATAQTIIRTLWSVQILPTTTILATRRFLISFTYGCDVQLATFIPISSAPCSPPRYRS